MTPLDRPTRAVSRLAISPLGYGHGKDRNRPLVATLQYGDMLVLRPHGTRRPESVLLNDVYAWLLRCRVNKERMEKLRERKAAKQQARERRKSLRILHSQ